GEAREGVAHAGESRQGGGPPAMIHRLARGLLAAAAASTWPWTAERPAGRTRWSGIPPAWSAPRPTYSSPFHDGRSIMDQGDSREASVNARGGPVAASAGEIGETAGAEPRPPLYRSCFSGSYPTQASSRGRRAPLRWLAVARRRSGSGSGPRGCGVRPR